MPDGAVLRGACWHSAGLAFLYRPRRSLLVCTKAAGEAHARARRATPGTEAGLPQHYLDRLSPGAKLERPGGESQENRKGSLPRETWMEVQEHASGPAQVRPDFDRLKTAL